LPELVHSFEPSLAGEFGNGTRRTISARNRCGSLGIKGSCGKRASLLDSPENRMRHSKRNVYQTLVLVWAEFKTG